MKPLSALTHPGHCVAGLRLATLKERLLREYLAQTPGAFSERWLRLAANEAEALAWQTPVPLLIFPALLQEKLTTVGHYATRQLEIWRRSAPP